MNCTHCHDSGKIYTHVSLENREGTLSVFNECPYCKEKIMKPTFNYKQNDKISFDTGVAGLSGKGIVVGCATEGAAVIGKTYMIKITESNYPIPNDQYPFDTISIFEVQMKKDE